MLSRCGSDTKTEPSTTSAKTSTSTTTSAEAAPSTPRSRDEDNYPAYQLGGTWSQEGQTKIVAQKTVVIPSADGRDVLQLNADGLENQGEIVGAATDVIDEQTTVTP